MKGFRMAKSECATAWTAVYQKKNVYYLHVISAVEIGDLSYDLVTLEFAQVYI